MGLYAVERFLIEFVRAKEDRFLLGLTTSQGMSILLVAAAAVLWIRQSAKPLWEPKNAPASARPTAKVKQARSTA
jgi:prolipoprotein diacylglyceryltransferase